MPSHRASSSNLKDAVRLGSTTAIQSIPAALVYPTYAPVLATHLSSDKIPGQLPDHTSDSLSWRSINIALECIHSLDRGLQVIATTGQERLISSIILPLWLDIHAWSLYLLRCIQSLDKEERQKFLQCGCCCHQINILTRVLSLLIDLTEPAESRPFVTSSRALFLVALELWPSTADRSPGWVDFSCICAFLCVCLHGQNDINAPSVFPHAAIIQELESQAMDTARMHLTCLLLEAHRPELNVVNLEAQYTLMTCLAAASPTLREAYLDHSAVRWTGIVLSRLTSQQSAYAPRAQIHVERCLMAGALFLIEHVGDDLRRMSSTVIRSVLRGEKLLSGMQDIQEDASHARKYFSQLLDEIAKYTVFRSALQRIGKGIRSAEQTQLDVGLSQGDVLKAWNRLKDIVEERTALEREHLWEGIRCSDISCATTIQGTQYQVCSRCRHSVYCSVDCQREDWSEHKLGCRLPAPSPIDEQFISFLARRAARNLPGNISAKIDFRTVPPTCTVLGTDAFRAWDGMEDICSRFPDDLINLLHVLTPGQDDAGVGRLLVNIPSLGVGVMLH
ncbi:uncharacterized protein EV420DRAFT_1634659 [Desarmillaria tabescens]|uniref:MYND-type domain-containing protein n=1 Tax=Armillaria tabescens TaxID=1929756 RepID=A0AA39TU45_ARMTA|nr:uncharacterized protein EV420DRAFT_1634659 [Desarmillaria tabescens]KAK0470217.1 hypothetical protein EV420DRAFT_1634659 [Desarmillaria tabescens]